MPSILIPYRFANGHQRENAKTLVEKKAAFMVEEGEHFSQAIADLVLKNYHHRDQLEQLAKNAKALSKANAAQSIVRSMLN